MVKSAPPRQSVVHLFLLLFSQMMFSDIFPGSKKLAGKSPAGPPIITISTLCKMDR